MAKKKMNKIKKPVVRKANTADAEQIHSLVLHYAKKEQMLPRSRNDIFEKIRDFFVVEKNGKIIACTSLHICWEDLSEIRSLAVAPRYTGKGYGAELVRAALREAIELGLSKVFVLTYKPDFFKTLGFRQIDMNELPKKIWADCIHCVHFPSCNETAMIIHL